jgi:iron complex outermembrane receptor protein
MSLTCLLALSASLAAHAQSHSNPQPPTVKETVVVTATASPESLQHVGRTVVVLTGDELRQLPIVSIADALRLLGSVDVRSRGDHGVQSDLAVRGAAFGQALVLVDGMRLNDAQSGHHNTDVPVPLADVERIEVLLGGASSLHGADATGGTVNVITRRRGQPFLGEIAVGQHGFVDVSGTASAASREVEHRLSGSFSRSDGFMPARDHQIGQGRYQSTIGRDTTAALGFVDKRFGANGFYGPSPSREWTSQWLGSVQHRFSGADRWQAIADVSYRTHGDRFVYDEKNPSLSQSRHRTHAVSGNLRWHANVSTGTQISVAATGGRETIGSSNLGDHAFTRASAGVELRQAIGSRLVIHPGVRFDRYSDFGASWNPSMAVSGWVSNRIRLRASGGHAFRIPTFTELFYVDPNHQGAGALDPETAWSADAGADAFGGAWTAGVTVFGRWEDNVIDWVRPSASVKWRTANIRHLDAHGIETSAQRRLGAGYLRVQYTWLTSQAPALDLLSKYALDYARHSLAASASRAWKTVRFGGRAEAKWRVDARRYWTLDAQVSRAIQRTELFVQATNVFDRQFQEIRGVDMPGRWLTAGLRVK